MIVKDRKELEVKCSPVSVKEGEEIGVRLLHELRESENGIGLAANQIGINKRVCVINVKEPLVLINPKIVEKSKEQFIFAEGCLSFPGHAIRTKRYRDIIISTEQSESDWYFSGAEENSDGKSGWDKGNMKKDQELRLLEAVCVQHEIDHLMGKTIHDREMKLEPTKVEKKIGRNQKVLIACGVDSKVVKYKKAIPLLENGWTLVESE